MSKEVEGKWTKGPWEPWSDCVIARVARERLSLANLHALSKALPTPTERGGAE